nr:LysR family transcriptional regulator [Ligilactobacillus salivarius]
MTRTMRKLERELGVPLFDRRAKNRLSLTHTGELAAQEAEQLLDAYDRFVETVRNDANLHNEIVVGSVAPGPLHFLEQAGERNAKWESSITVRHSLIEPDAVLDDLLLRKETMIITDREVDDPRVESLYLGEEYLGVAIDNFNPLAQRTSVTFADLAGMDFVVAHDIGPWRAVIEEQIPGAHFLYQQDLSALEQISKYSAFPFFYSNLTRSLRMTDERFMPHTRTAVSIADPANRIDFYATFLGDNRRLALPIQQYLAQHRPREQ